jgi:anhydro-N-acetylmuramic acid kinase
MSGGDIKDKYLVIGCMSGTSCDGIDTALLETDGMSYIKFLNGDTLPYHKQLRDKLKIIRSLTTEEILHLEHALTVLHAEAIKDLIEKYKLKANDIQLIGFHGHTVIHQPEHEVTWQIGDGPLLANLTGIDVVYNFRKHDMAYGGQGAPLTPVFHRAIAEKVPKPLVFVNIGGVSNLTYIDNPSDENKEGLIAFDCGPGVGIIDDWISTNTTMGYDEDGKIAMKGQIHKNIISLLFRDRFFKLGYPKSLDRYHFKDDYLSGLSLEDGAITACALTAESIVYAIDKLPKQPRHIILCGGGRNHPVITNMIKKLSQIPVLDIDSLHIDGDLLEAYAFGYLAVRHVKKLPISFPHTTATPRPTLGGVFCPASR